MKDQALRLRVQAFADRLRREDVNMHGFILSVDGEEKARAYYAPFREGEPHRTYSVSKTMTALAVGMLADEGRISLDDGICEYFRDWLGPETDGRLLRLHIRDMLRMATCYRKTTYREHVDENWARTFFTAVPTHEPGTVFHYDTSCSQVLAALVRRISGQEVMDFLEERLFAPLQCTDRRYWLRDPSGCCQGGSGLCMSLRDMHKVAQCLLEGGRGLVPAWFVREMSRKHIETLLQTNEEERYGYGWQCWQTRAGWAMYGMGGQLAIMCPDKKALLTTIADTRLDPFGVQRIYNAFFEEIWPYLDSEDMDAEELHLAVQSLPDHPEYALEHTGEYTFAENPLGFRRLSLEKDCLCYVNARGEARLPFGRGYSAAAAWPGFPSVPALVSGGWVEPGVLRIRCFAVGDAPCGFDMMVCFREHSVTVQCRRSSDPVTEGYEGVASGIM